MSEKAKPGPSSSGLAPEKPLPQAHFYSVEFPGYVRPESVNKAIQHLGGQNAIERAFKRNSTRSESFLELSWRPENPFAHPVSGNVVHSNNILLKVTKRRRKRRNGQDLAEPEGEFTAEAIGVTNKIVRFRGMADFQYDPEPNDPVVLLRDAMNRMDVQYLSEYAIPPEKEDYALPAEESSEVMKSNLRLIPPPLFSRQSIPQMYNYKQNNVSVITTYVDKQTGEEEKRYINKGRWKGYGPISISFQDKNVPTEPPSHMLAELDDTGKRICEILKEKFLERPCWTKRALFNQMSAPDVREIVNSKFLTPMICYVFVDGPWRDTLIRYGYDPRTESSARFYQRIYFRNVNHPFIRASITSRKQGQKGPEKQSTTTEATGNEPPSHVFDGMHLTQETAAYQLCDITDPMLKEMIEDENSIRDECNERDGWYTTHALERIKAVLRHKFFALLEGHIPTDEECKNLLENPIGSHTTHRFYSRKHNMAKGAVPPEDAAAIRLRAALDSSVKSATNRAR